MREREMRGGGARSVKRERERSLVVRHFSFFSFQSFSFLLFLLAAGACFLFEEAGEIRTSLLSSTKRVESARAQEREDSSDNVNQDVVDDDASSLVDSCSFSSPVPSAWHGDDASNAVLEFYQVRCLIL